MKLGKIILVLLIIGGWTLFNTSFFLVNEGQQAIITQFGRPIGDPITEAGFHFKMPFTQEVRYVDKRILSWDGFPNQIPTKDKKYIKVDTTARWQVVDALKFIQTVRNETGAKARLDAILDSATRDVISNHSLVEAVRNSNKILDDLKRGQEEIEQQKKSGVSVLEEGVTGEIESVSLGREKLSEMIREGADKELASFGISLIDVQFRRISYEKSVEAKVYERMISERQRVAEKIRSIGQGEKAKIEGRIARDLEKITSEAYRRSQVLKGNGEAKAIAIYAKALSRDPGFYEFTRSMEAYRSSIKEDAKMILSSDSEFLKYLKKAP